MKLKRIKWFSPPLESKNIFYTQVPTPLVLNDKIRILYAGRVKNITHIYSIDLSPPPKLEVINFSDTPLLYPNKSKGTFDDEGVMPSFLFKENNKHYLFYSGWNSRNSVPYHNATGIAEYHLENNSIVRLYDGPIMDRTYNHPYLAVTPCVWKDKEMYNALYISGLAWKKYKNKHEPLYVIKFANSHNLIDWERPIEQFIESRYELECFSNPTVKVNKDGLDILFCSRNCYEYRDDPDRGYKLGYATFVNGKVTRNDVEWLGHSFVDLDDIMQCYPSFLKFENKDYVVYNGNGFGSTGFGIAQIL